MTPYLALFAWPIITAILFAFLRLQVAVVTSVVAGFLLLPPSFGIDFPLLPRIDKALVPSVAAMVMAVIANARQREPEPGVLPGWLPRSRIVLVLLALLVIGAFMTPITNQERVFVGPRILPAMGIYDAFSLALSAIVLILPLLLARKYLGSPEAHRTLLNLLVLAGVLYSCLALYEVRMSPQLNRMVYGYFPHSFLQHIRWGGFRPVVFLEHGLWLGIFLAMTVLAAAGAARAADYGRRAKFAFAAIWLFVTLFFAKTFGALIIVIFLLPFVLLLGPRKQILVAAAFSLAVLTYPMLRNANLIPIDTIASIAAIESEQRVGSFTYRLENEDILLERAQEKPLFGWGGWGRDRVYDRESGRDVSTTDGFWVITFGQGGWVRYVAVFGLLTSGVLVLALRRKTYEIGLATSALALILVANLLDLIPNSALSPVTWLIAGALIGRLEYVRSMSDAPSRPSHEEVRRGPVYTRHPPKGGMSAGMGAEVLYSRRPSGVDNAVGWRKT